MLQTLDLTACLAILKKNYIGHLAFISGSSPYIVPITYYHDAEEKCILSYSAKGFKIAAMRNYHKVAFQVDDIESVQKWSSVLVHGNYDELHGSTAKKYLHRFADGVKETINSIEGEKPKFIQDFSSMLQKEASPIVYRIPITDITGKFRKD